jgi:hypothetical protein
MDTLKISSCMAFTGRGEIFRETVISPRDCEQTPLCASQLISDSEANTDWGTTALQKTRRPKTARIEEVVLKAVIFK